MNTIEFLKNGSGIHIKKKNRGKFTDYCGGKVTNECIRKAKASGNPTLVKRATEDLKIDLDGFYEGPNAIVFGKTLLEPIKVIAKFAKEHDKAEIRVGIINGARAELDTIKEYAAIPSREGLLTMLAGGMIQYVRDLSIGLNLYAEQLESK
jgi:large subunit ribosomal protein L10